MAIEIEPHGVDVGEGWICPGQVLGEQRREQRGVILVNKGTHSVLNHTACWSQKVLATRNSGYHFLDDAEEITEIAA